MHRGILAALLLIGTASCTKPKPAPVTATPTVPTASATPTPTPTPTITPTSTPTASATPTVAASATPDDGCPRGCMDPPPGCDIKGNINAEGVKIYHEPGQQYYSRTVINPSAGERWFCTRSEAEANGWRRSKV